MSNFSFGSLNIEAFKRSISNFGYQRSDRYNVYFSKVSASLKRSILYAGVSELEFQTQLNDRLQSVKLPEQSLATNTIKVSGVDYEHPYQTNYEGDIEMTFLLDKTAFLRRVFNNWLNDIHLGRSGAFRYKTDYACNIIIELTNQQGTPQSGCLVFDVFPKTVSSFSTEGESTKLVEQSVTFSYKNYVNGFTRFSDPDIFGPPAI